MFAYAINIAIYTNFAAFTKNNLLTNANIYILMKNLQHLAFTAILLFSISSLSAQQKLGLRIEYGMQHVKTQNSYLIGANNRIDYNLSIQDITPVQSIGLYAYKSFGNLFIQPEFLYSSYSVQYAIEDFTDSRPSTSTASKSERIQQFDIPVFAGLRFNNFRIGAGPVFHIGETIESELEVIDNINIKPTKLSAGLQLGLGFDFSFFAIDIKYNREFNQLSDHIRFENQPSGLTSNINSLRLGLAFAIGQ